MEIRPLTEGVYLHTSYGDVPGYGLYPSNGQVVVVEDDAYIIDTPWPEADTDKLIAWIEQQGLQLVASLSTHFHSDRTSGIPTLNKAGVTTYASTMTNQLLAEHGKELAAVGFDPDGFWLLKDRIYAWHPGAGHSLDNVVVWLPEQKLLVGGCLVRSLETNSMGNTADGDIEEWPRSIQSVETAHPDISIVVPGHGLPGNADLLKHTRAIFAPKE